MADTPASNLRTLQTSFTAGELDPLMRMRTDLQSYFQGMKKGRNIALFAQGGWRRRPGTIYRAVLDNPTVLHEYSFGENQSYIFAFSNTKLMIFDETGTLLQTITSCPWLTANINELTLTSSADTIIVCHQTFWPQYILRTGASSFTLANFAFEEHSAGQPRYQPYYKFANDSVTLTSSATSGTSVTLTTSADHWTSADVGSIIRRAGKECIVTGYSSATQVTVTIRETFAATTAIADWDEQTFSTKRGHPRSVSFHDQRLFFGGSTSRPDGIWASKTNAFFNFDIGTVQDDEAIDTTVTGDRVAEVRHLISTRNLQIFTNGAELYVPQSPANPLTPSNISFIQQTPYGCSQKVNPLKFDGATLFMQRTGQTIREYLWNDTEQAYTSGAVSLRSSHLIGTSVDSTAILGTDSRPEQYAFFVKTDGDMAVFHSVRSEELAGWGLWTTTGNFKSVTSVENKVFAAVERVINGSTVVWLEEFNWDETLDASKVFAVDADRTTNGTFDTDASWTKGTGWTIDAADNNAAVCSGSQSSDSDLEQAVTGTNGRVYEVKFTITNYTAGTLTPRVKDGTGTAVSANGTFVQYVTASSGSNVQMRANSSFAGTLDTISVKEITKTYTAAHLPNTVIQANTNSNSQHAGEYTTDGSGVSTTLEYLNGATIGMNFDITCQTMPVDAVIRSIGAVTGEKKRISRVVISILGTQSITLSNNHLIVAQSNDDFSDPPTAAEGEYQFFMLGWETDPTIIISQGQPLPITVRGLYAEVTA